VNAALFGERDLNRDPLDLIEVQLLLAPTIVELRRARRGMVRHCRGFFQPAAVLELRRDPGCPEAVM
jgi:hypothetical protein